MPTRTMIEDHNRGPAPALALRIPLRSVGFAMLALVTLLLLSFASWNVDDPSLSYATAEPARNWLGFGGAVAADLFIQMLGLGSLGLVLPLALWGWALVRRRPLGRPLLRTIGWLGGSVLLCGVLAFLPTPATWPLPTGLGGLVGQMFSGLAVTITGADAQPVTATLFAVILAAPMLALLWLALGPMRSEPAAERPRRARTAKVELDEDDIADERGRDGSRIMDVVIGGMAHLAYSAQSALKRARANHRERASERTDWRDGAVEPNLELAVGAALDVEPLAPQGERRPIRIFNGDQPAETEDYEAAPFEEDDAPPFDLDDPLPQQGAHVEPPAGARFFRSPNRNGSQAGTPSPRVAAPAPRPAQGNRVTREAQSSFLDDPQAFELPSLSLLAEPKRKGLADEHRPERLEAQARRLEGVLQDFGVKGDIINVRPGPVVTLYELEPAPGIKSSRVISLADDIARSMSAISARVAVVPGRNAIGIELPNESRETVYLREMLASVDYEGNKSKLPVCLGKTIGGEPIIVDLARMPHLLIAGTTGSGKSVGINTMILSLLYRMTPEQCRLIMIDPKMLELSIYDGIPHLLTPVVTDPGKAVVALKWAVREMEDRYKKMSKIGVRNIDGFNQRVSEAAARGEIITRTVQTGFDRETGEAIFESEEFDLAPLPFIVIIVDEMADLMMVAGKDIEGAIQRLAQMARAAGIHIIMATQRPSVDVITGTIKANFPTRVSFQVTSKIDSRTILGEQGAEQLLGNGDMLYMAGGGRIRRLHGPFVSDGEVESIVNHLKSQGSPDYLDSITAEDDDDDAGDMPGDDYSGSGDELYDKAVNVVLTDKKASTSYVQRRLGIGYNKAASLIERMEKEGVISPANSSGKREILVGDNANGY